MIELARACVRPLEARTAVLAGGLAAAAVLTRPESLPLILAIPALVALCRERGVAVQTIKSVARRRWQDESERRFSWYEPLQDPDAIRHAVHYVLKRPGLFLNTSSDATILPQILEAAHTVDLELSDAQLEKDTGAFSIEPLFVPGVSEQI